MKHRSEANLHDEGVCVLALVSSSCVSAIVIILLVPTVSDPAAVAIAMASGAAVFLLDALSEGNHIER